MHSCSVFPIFPDRRIRIALLGIAVTVALVLPSPATFAAPPKPSAHSPAGDVQGAERKIILDAARIPVEKELKQKIVFRVEDLRVRNGWAFVEGEPLTPTEAHPDYSQTKYATVLPNKTRAGFFALLRRGSGAEKGWTVVHYALGPDETIVTEPLEKYTKPPYSAPGYVVFGLDTAHTPVGTERKTILDVVRIPVERDLHQKVVFRVDRLRVLNDWAFLYGEPLRPDGGRPDYRKTKYQDAIDNGAFDNNLSALLKRRNGQWSIVALATGATDVAWDGWDEKYHAPRALFPYPTEPH